MREIVDGLNGLNEAKRLNVLNALIQESSDVIDGRK